MKLRKINIIAICFALCFANLFAADFDKNSNNPMPMLKDVKVGKLPNGFTYFIMKNNKPENYGHFRLVVNAGAINEDDDQNGLAHFTEHLCFNGTKNFPKNELLDVLQKFGIRFGADVNASTGLEVTMYELPIPVNDEKLLEKSFQVLEDWAHNVTMDGDQIESERDVIIAEWRQRNNAFMRLNDLHASKLYYNSKYAKRNLIGDTSLLRSFKHDVIRRFYKDWYRPELMALIAVGDFDVNKIEKMIIKNFSNLTPVKNPRPDIVEAVPLHKETLVSIAQDKELPFEMFSITIKKPTLVRDLQSTYYYDMKSQLYDMMFSERIQDLSRSANPPFMQAGGGESQLYGDKASYQLRAVYNPGGFDKAFEAIMTAAMDVKQNGFTQAELDRAKKNFMSYIEKAYNERNTTENSDYVDELTSYFNGGEAMPGIETEYEIYKYTLPQIALNEINQLAADRITKENCVIILNAPDKDGIKLPTESEILDKYNQMLNTKVAAKKEEAASKPFFTKNLKPGKIVKTSKNDKLGTEEVELSNGARIILKKTDFKEDEILFKAFSFGGSSMVEDKDFASGEFATVAISEAGIDEFKKTDLEKTLAGATFGLAPSIDEYTEGFDGSSSKKDFETMLQMLHLYFTSPRKDKEAFESFSSRVKAYIENRGASQNETFNDSLEWTLYGHHFRKQPFTSKIFNMVDYDKAFNIFKERFNSPSDFTFLFVGDLDIEKAKSLVEKYIGSIEAAKTKETYKDRKVRLTTKKTINRFNKGKEDRAIVNLSFTGDFENNQENRFNLNSLVEVLELRLTETIREKMSGVYSPSIFVSNIKHPAQQYNITIKFVTEPKRVDEIIGGCFEVINKLKKEADEDGADKIKKAQQKERLVDVKTNGYWLGTMYNAFYRGENPESILNLDNLVNKINAKTIHQTAKKYLNTDNMIQVVAFPENM